MKPLLASILFTISLHAQISVTPTNGTNGSNGNILTGNGQGGYGTPLASIGDANLTSNTTFGNTALRVCHAQYSFATDGGGAPGLITPANNCTIPANSTIYNVAIRWTTPGTGATNTTSIGLTGTGGGAAVLLGATAVASLTGNVQGLVLPSVSSGWVRITTAGTVTLTTAVVALTGGVCEIFVFYFVSST